jgi:hypothetical protein
MKNLLILILITASFSAFSQIGKFPGGGLGGGGLGNVPSRVNKNGKQESDTIKHKVKAYPITDYKYFNAYNDTIIVDTVLTIRHMYKYTYVFKDDFLKLPFQNVGQTYNNLSLSTSNSFNPDFVASGKKANYLQHNEIHFYNVPTPYSDLSYLNGISEGQTLKAFITANINPRTNLSVGYKGVSSRGLYQHEVTSLGRFFATLNHQSVNKRYFLKMYYVTNDIKNEESGGIKDVAQFEQSGETFKDRGRIEVLLSNAENMFIGRRMYIGQQYKAFNKRDFYLVNNIKFHQQAYSFEQSSPSALIGKTLSNDAVKDTVTLQRFQNFTGIRFKRKNMAMQTGLNYVYQYYRLNSIKEINALRIPMSMLNNDLVIASKLKFKWKKIDFKTQFDFALTPGMQGYLLKIDAGYHLNKDILLKAQLKSISKRPDYKYIMYQSAYTKFNWYNPDIDNEYIQELSGALQHKKWGKLQFKQSLINNYNYFAQDSLPKQDAAGVVFSGLQYSNDFTFHKIGLSTDIMLQQVLQGDDILSLPSYILRSSLYFSNHYYKRHLFVQTGITAKYFEPYYANAYNPVLADFLVQRTQKIGGYPLLDVFVNFKIKRFRFFFKLEHVNALWEDKTPTYYSAPLHPYRDFSMRMGLRWIFFN